MTTIYFWTIVAYLIALIGVGAIRSRGVKTQEDFSVAGRKLSVFVLFGTMLATWIGTGSIFGNAEKTYRVGIAAAIIPLSGVLGIVVLYFLAGRVRRLKQYTVQDILETRYNAAARVFGVITLVIAYTTIVSYQYRAAAAVLNLTLPSLSIDKAVIIVTVFIILYTAMAGMFSVAYTDVAQGVTMIIGIAVAFPFFWHNAGGLEGMHRVLPPSHFQLFGPITPLQAMGLLLPSFLLILGDANMYQRFFSARNEGVAKRAVIWMLVGVAFMEFMIIFTAWVCSALEPNLQIHGRVIAYASRDHLPVAIGALMLTTIIAIVVSTAESYLLVPATCVIRDIYQRFVRPDASEANIVLLSRLIVVILGVVAFGLSRLSSEFLSVALYAYTIYGASITPSLLAAFFWKRATAAGAIASIIAGTFVTIVWEQMKFGSAVPARFGWPDVTIDAVIPAIVVSVITLVAVSLLTTPPSAEKLKAFF
ncbi:MAG TPA: sodium:solute symporter family protein [Acidobacteriota bacterium]|nr:sodium:solute symporter family protein [Acidobacteriota bacterium]